MATQVYNQGKFVLFNNGWTPQINYAILYTNTGTQVDVQEVTFAYNSGDQSIRPSANIVFDVAGGTDDVSYVEIGRFVEGIDPAPDIFTPYYRRDFASLYDFTNTGTLTIDAFTLTLSNSYLTTVGKEKLWTSGFEGITWAKLYKTGDVLVDTQNTTFTANSGSYNLICDADIIFDVPSGATGVSYVTLGYTDGSPVVLYNRALPTTYNFPTAGTLKIDSWVINVS